MIEIKAPVEAFEDADEGVEGLLEDWLVAEGDAVTAGQPVADAIVVKTSFQVCAPCDGTIGEIVVPKGDTFAVGAVLATMEELPPGAGRHRGHGGSAGVGAAGDAWADCACR